MSDEYDWNSLVHLEVYGECMNFLFPSSPHYHRGTFVKRESNSLKEYQYATLSAKSIIMSGVIVIKDEVAI